MSNTPKTFLFTAALLLLVAVSVFSQSPKWRSLPGAPVSGRHEDVHFVNPNVGWIVNGGGQIWKTMDGGGSWALQFVAGVFLRSVGFVDSTTGWAGVLQNDTTKILYQTTDGGVTWSLVTNIPSPRPRGICGISIVNDSVIYASGPYYGPARVIKTTDRGASWTSIDLSTYAWGLVDCFFFNPDSGFVVGNIGTGIGSDTTYARVLFTSDGGATWSIRYSGSRPSERCWKIQFLTGTTGYVSIEKFSSGGVYYLKTTDGGVTWSDELFLNTPYHVQGIGFISDSVGWLGGWGGDTYETTDTGASWHLAGFGQIVNRFRLLGDTLAYAVGQTVYKYSVDSIIPAWAVKASGTTNILNGVSFATAATGAAVGNGGTIRRTTDGGLTWENRPSGTANNLLGVSFGDASTGTATGGGGTILRTTDGGLTWVSRPSGTTEDLFGVSYGNPSTGTAVGGNGTILRTTDGGLNWTSQTSGTITGLLGVSFTDSNTGTAVGFAGTVLHTTNGGASWTQQTSGTGQFLAGVFFSDNSSGTAVGGNGTILHTTDGGANWMPQTTGTILPLKGVLFVDALSGIAVGEHGTILRTTNGGASWILQSSGTIAPLNGVFVTDAYTGTVVGASGTILRTAEAFACPAARGDLNGDGMPTSVDVVLLLNCVFLGEGTCSLCFSDVNCDGALTPVDVVLELNKVFLDAPFPCP